MGKVRLFGKCIVKMRLKPRISGSAYGAPELGHHHRKPMVEETAEKTIFHLGRMSPLGGLFPSPDT